MQMTQLKTKEIVQRTLDAIVDTLAREGRIELRNFGVFEVKQRKARKARNPRTGDRVEVESKNVVTFKPGKELEERVRDFEVNKETTPTEDDIFLQVLSADPISEPINMMSDGIMSNDLAPENTFDPDVDEEEQEEAVMASVGNDLE